MQRRRFLIALGLGGVTVAISPALLLLPTQAKGEQSAVSDQDFEFIHYTPKEWRLRLTREQFWILREEGTERPFSSPLNDESRKGVYHCAGCDLALFDSATKYDSRTGWPSFYQPIDGSIETRIDYRLFIPRTEYHCRRCGGHQGHVFDDGPPPTGKRYCNNGIALKFIPAA